jgi:hypothetical protein
LTGFKANEQSTPIKPYHDSSHEHGGTATAGQNQVELDQSNLDFFGASILDTGASRYSSTHLPQRGR